jgi:Caspase domain
MSRVVILLAGIWSLQFSQLAVSQACTANAMRSVYDAQTQFASGNATAAASSLEKAADLCVNSCKVLTAIAETYTQMENGKRAARYAEDARALGCVIPTNLGQASAHASSPAPSATTRETQSYVRQKWALVVGINRFADSQVPPLRLSAKDASDFAGTLMDPQIGRFHKETVTVLLNEEATLKRIRAEISKIARNARPDDLVVLYFSTHGSSKDIDVATEQGKTGYIVAYDSDTTDLYSTAFSMEELKRVVDVRINAGRVITFLDTCYSGDTLRHGAKSIFLSIPDDSIAKVAQAKGRVVITSSRGTEQSWECDEYQNSCFTHELLDAMRQKKGLSTVSDLYKHIQLSVPDVVMRQKHARQNPVMQPESGNINIVIGTPVD